MFSKNTEVTGERVHCRFAVEKLQFCHFLIEVYVVLVGLTLNVTKRVERCDDANIPAFQAF